MLDKCYFLTFDPKVGLSPGRASIYVRINTVYKILEKTSPLRRMLTVFL